MKILLVDSNEPINHRNVKIIDSLNTFPDCEVIVVTWQRDLKKEEQAYTSNKKYLFIRDSKLGDKLKKASNLLAYLKFIKKVNKQEKPDFIIASHYDMLVLSSLIKLQNQKLIYENLDVPTSYNAFVLRALRLIERLALRRCDYVIYASRFYPTLYPFFKKHYQILENLPKIDVLTAENKIVGKKKKVISFIGGVRYIEILFRLIEEAAKFSDIEIRIHGEGHESDKLKEFISQRKIENGVKITGAYDYGQIPELYLNSDFIWSVYPNRNFNVKYAISNKFHESIFFEIPAIFSTETKLGDYVTNQSIGLAVDPNSNDEIFKLLAKIDSGGIRAGDFVKNIKEFKEKNRPDWDQGIGELVSWMKDVKK